MGWKANTIRLQIRVNSQVTYKLQQEIYLQIGKVGYLIIVRMESQQLNY